MPMSSATPVPNSQPNDLKLIRTHLLQDGGTAGLRDLKLCFAGIIRHRGSSSRVNLSLLLRRQD